MEERRERLTEFDEALVAFTDKLEPEEKMVEEMKEAGVGQSSSKNLKEQLETLEVWSLGGVVIRGVASWSVAARGVWPLEGTMNIQ